MTMCIIIGVIVMMIMIDESIASTIKKQQIINNNNQQQQQFLRFKKRNRDTALEHFPPLGKITAQGTFETFP